MIKLGRAVVTALALGALVSQTASAAVICETNVPASNGETQLISICTATGAGAATGSANRSQNLGNFTYTLNVLKTLGASTAHLYIVNGSAGSLVAGCEAHDISNGTGDSSDGQCTSSLSPNNLKLYLIH